MKMRNILGWMLVICLVLVFVGCEANRQANFNRDVVRFGFGKAVVFHENTLKADFFQGLNFDQWLQVYREAPAGSTLEQRAAAGMVAATAGFAQSVGLYMGFPSGTREEAMAEKRMLELATTKVDWAVVFKLANTGSKTEIVAFERLSDMSKSFSDWFDLYRFMPSNGDYEAKTLQKMSELASTQDEWQILFLAAPSGSEIETLARGHLKSEIFELERGFLQPSPKSDDKVPHNGT